MGNPENARLGLSGSPECLYLNVGDRYNPAENAAQAFELLCWLAERVPTQMMLRHNGYLMVGKDDYPCSSTAELRLAIMRAVVKVKENQDGR